MYSRNNFSRFSYFRTLYPYIPITMHGLFVRRPPSMLSFSLISFLSFLFSARKLLLLEEVWTILHATPTPPKHHLSFLLDPLLPSQNQESLLLAKCRSPSNVFARFRLSRRQIFCKFLNLKSWFLPASLFLETGGNVKRRRWHSFRTLWTRSIFIFHFLSRLADLEAQRRWWPVWHGEQGGSQRWRCWTRTTRWWTTTAQDLRAT